MRIPTKGQKTIPLDQWRRFMRVADWWDRTYSFASSVAAVVFGFDILVKTPAGGIPARSGTTIYGVECIVCVEAESGTAGQKTIVETADRRMVYNIYPDAVTELVYVPTGLTWRGTRYVTGEPCS